MRAFRRVAPALRNAQSAWVAFLLICAAWAIVSGYTSITTVIKAEMFPTAVRAMGVGIPYALTVAIFGGTVDGVAQFCKTELKWEAGFFWYAIACTFISQLFYTFLPDTKNSNSHFGSHDRFATGLPPKPAW